jgi:predicted  nucleic acid-binding Zn-ribbon protein
MHPVEQQILSSLNALQELTREITALLKVDPDSEKRVDNYEAAQKKLDERKTLLRQFESVASDLQDIDEDEQKQLEGADQIQQQYDMLMEQDEQMQKAIAKHLASIKEQTRTNKKERGANQKYNDQRSGSVDNSLFITSKLEG